RRAREHRRLDEEPHLEVRHLPPRATRCPDQCSQGRHLSAAAWSCNAEREVLQRQSRLQGRRGELERTPMSQLLCHLWGDYILQSDWMAKDKSIWWFPCLLHVAFYSTTFL